MVTDLRVQYPGLLRERLPSGNFRYRVRVEKSKSRRIALPVGPDHPEFNEIYLSARRGISQAPTKKPSEKAIRHSVAWLTHLYLEHLSDMVDKGRNSPATLSQRRHFFREMRGYRRPDGSIFAEMHMDIPQSELLAFRDSMAHTPGKADNLMTAVRSMYKWAASRGLTSVNPASGIPAIKVSRGGATPWTVADLKQFRETHAKGSMAHLALTLFMFTACRVSDAIVLGRSNEYTEGDVRWIKWSPAKKNAAPVDIPMLAPLVASTRSGTVIGATYLLTQYGRPFSSTDSFRNRFKAWCVEAGLPDRSPHGIRKAAGHLLAHEGATEYEVMTILGHAQAATSEIYTKAVERRRLAVQAMRKLGNFDW